MVTISIRSDIAEMYIDGSHRETYVHYIIAEYCNGARYRLNNSELVQGDFSTEEVEKTLMKLVFKIQQHIAYGGKLNMQHWDEIEPEYGSVAWQQWSRFN